jgi:hypothetical protein
MLASALGCSLAAVCADAGEIRPTLGAMVATKGTARPSAAQISLVRMSMPAFDPP